MRGFFIRKIRLFGAPSRRMRELIGVAIPAGGAQPADNGLQNP